MARCLLPDDGQMERRPGVCARPRELNQRWAPECHWIPSIAVDQNGNAAIGYSTSSENTFPSIRYAGRLATDPLNNLGQGEAIMTDGHGAQTGSFGRWGDYSMLTIDPAD